MPSSISLLFLSCILGSVSLEAPYVCDVGYPFKSADDPSTPENDVELYGVLWVGSSDGTDLAISSSRGDILLMTAIALNNHFILGLHRQATRPNPRLGAPENLTKQIPPFKRIRHSLRLLRRSTTHNEKRNTNTAGVETHRTLRQLQDKRREKRKTCCKRTHQTTFPRRNLQHT